MMDIGERKDKRGSFVHSVAVRSSSSATVLACWKNKDKIVTRILFYIDLIGFQLNENKYRWRRWSPFKKIQYFRMESSECCLICVNGRKINKEEHKQNTKIYNIYLYVIFDAFCLFYEQFDRILACYKLGEAGIYLCVRVLMRCDEYCNGNFFFEIGSSWTDVDDGNNVMKRSWCAEGKDKMSNKVVTGQLAYHIHGMRKQEKKSKRKREKKTHNWSI